MQTSLNIRDSSRVSRPCRSSGNFVWLGNSAGDFWGVKLWSKDFFRFCLKPQEFYPLLPWVHNGTWCYLHRTILGTVRLQTRSIFDFYFFFFLMFYCMNYNFYSYVHKHRECRLKQQYNGCKSPKGQVKTGPSWTYASYSKNGGKGNTLQVQISKTTSLHVYLTFSLPSLHDYHVKLFYEWHKANSFFFYLSELSYCP